jgi:hypothetical protein
MQIIFERDSVCAGDDVMAPNRKVFTFENVPMIYELLGQDGPARTYLPSVSQSRIIWSVYFGSERVAEIKTSEGGIPFQFKAHVADRLLPSGTIHFVLLRQERVFPAK